MTTDTVMSITKDTLETTIMIMSPLLGVAMVVGLFIGIIQAVTNIHEQTIAFFPKVFAVIAVFLFCLPWMLQMLISFTQRLFLDFSKYSS
ncbi:MAG TPA: flagellar biosynthesis protein FliQ [Candidatus Brocadiales bacterium]|nr:flagellar biosynthesis protein FliQ [Candidatus Brocadiales bacterium]